MRLTKEVFIKNYEEIEAILKKHGIKRASVYFDIWHTAFYVEPAVENPPKDFYLNIQSGLSKFYFNIAVCNYVYRGSIIAPSSSTPLESLKLAIAAESPQRLISAGESQAGITGKKGSPDFFKIPGSEEIKSTVSEGVEPDKRLPKFCSQYQKSDS